MGSKSGRDEYKLSITKVRLEEGLKIDAPILADCRVNIECKVVDSIVTSSHEMFVGKIEYIHVQEDLMDSEEKIDFSKMSLL